MSTLTEEGVIAVKNTVCEHLLDQRVEVKMKYKKINDCLNRFHVAMPKPRDQKERPACVPQTVLDAKSKEAGEKDEKEKRKLERDLEDENGGAGVYSASLRKYHILLDNDWKDDIMPEIFNGHNVYDYADPDVEQRLEELLREEGIQLEQDEDDYEMDDGKTLTPEEQEALNAIRKKKRLLIRQHRIKKSTAESRPTIPRKFNKDRDYTSKRMGRQLSALGLDPTAAIERSRSRSVSRMGRKRDRSVDGDAMDMDEDQSNRKKLRLRSLSQSRSTSRPRGEIVPGDGFKDSAQKLKAIAIAHKSNKNRNKEARRGEADRVIPTLKPKHLYSGKRGKGKTDRR